MSNLIDIKVPDIGDFKDVPVIEVFVKVGDTVKAEDPLVSLESDKATMDVPAPHGGVVKAIPIKVGDRVSEGSVIVQFAGAGAAAPAPEAAKPSVSAPPSAVNAPAGVAEVRIPDIGDFKDVPVIEIFVKVGDSVKAEDPLVSLESDKATMDVPAPLAGVVQEHSRQGRRQGQRRQRHHGAGHRRGARPRGRGLDGHRAGGGTGTCRCRGGARSGRGRRAGIRAGLCRPCRAQAGA